jgi:hypothetical protein
VPEPTYEILCGFSEGLALVSVNGKFGYIDSARNAMIESTRAARRTGTTAGVSRPLLKFSGGSGGLE